MPIKYLVIAAGVCIIGVIWVIVYATGKWLERGEEETAELSAEEEEE